jgi:sortase A
MADTLQEQLPAEVGETSRPAPSRTRRRVRRLGTAIMVVGVVLLAYGASIFFWHDPATDLYARWKQHQLAERLDAAFKDYQASAPAIATPQPEPALGVAPALEPPAGPSPEELVARSARRFLASLKEGEPVGRIVIPKLDVKKVVINGTRWGADLSQGPGRYPETSIPGLGKTMGIAGHRTTFGAPFRHIDQLERGVFAHEIVENDDWSVIRNRGFDTLMLSACHPLFSASHRWIVYARLVSVDPTKGASYRLPGAESLAASASG